MATKFCGECGNKLNEGAKFCPKCGWQTDAPQEFNPYGQSPNANNAFYGKQNSGNAPNMGIIVTIVLSSIVIIIMTFLLITTIKGRMNGGAIGADGLEVSMPDEAIFLEKEVIAEDIINPVDGMIQLGDGQIKMAFDELCIDEPVEAKIVELEVENPPDDSILNVYDFTIDSKKDISGVVTIEVPYDPGQIPDGRTVAECVSGVYYNEELHEWIEESYTIDETRNVVIIKTTHLSPHGTRIAWNDSQKHWNGLFINLCEGTPYEYVIPLDSDNALGKLTQEEMIEVLEELKRTGLNNPQQAFNDTALSIMGGSGSFSDIGVKTFRLTSYAGKWSKILEDRLGNLSGALVLAQFASDAYHETPQAKTYFSLLKGLTYWKGSVAAASLAGPVGGTIATVVLAGMFLYEIFWEPIDIPQYIEESNHKVIVDAYNMYYHSGQNYRSKKDWMEEINAVVNKVYKEIKAPEDFDNIFKKLLDEEVTAYATEFFNEKPSKIREYVGKSFDIKQGYLGSYDRVYSKTDRKRNEKYVKEYVTEILSGQYDGITTSLQDELIHILKDEIYKDTIPAVMNMRKEYQYLKQLDYFRQEQKEICQYFNTKISLLIRDRGCKYGETSQYAGFYIAPKIVERDPEYQLEKWIIRLDNSGKGQLNYNLIAHQMAGDFTQLYLYDKEDYDNIILGTAEPIKVLDIGTIASNEHEILFGKEAVDITIIGERDITYETDSGAKVNHTFEAVSDYTGECSIKWDFGDGSNEIETEGNKSSTSHEYEKEGVFTVTAGLFDNNDMQLAEDTITITIASERDISKSETTVYTGTIPFSDYNSYEDEGNFVEIDDQDITVIKYADGTWRVFFDYSVVSREKWAPATDVTRKASFNVDIDNIAIPTRDRIQVDGSYAQSGTYQGKDVSVTEQANYEIYHLGWYENENGKLNLKLEFDHFFFDIQLTKLADGETIQ